MWSETGFDLLMYINILRKNTPHTQDHKSKHHIYEYTPREKSLKHAVLVRVASVTTTLRYHYRRTRRDTHYAYAITWITEGE